MLKGETILSGGPTVCSECKVRPQLRVCHSNAGYYIGTMCNCGPYSRESDYYPTYVAADVAFKKGPSHYART
jgi:hypothetical protein